MEKAHKNLKVWQNSIKLVKLIYEVTNELPGSEQYGLCSQMRRAAVSIPSNIAEGAARQGDKESIQFFTVARASLSELDTHVKLCNELSFLKPSSVSHLTSSINDVDALLSGLIKFRKSKSFYEN